MSKQTSTGLTYYENSDAPDLAVITQGMQESVEQHAVMHTSATGPRRLHIKTGINGNTDANGYITLAHGAPFTPRVVQVQETANGATLGYPIATDAYTATQVRVRFASYTGSGVLASASIGTVALLCWE